LQHSSHSCTNKAIVKSNYKGRVSLHTAFTQISQAYKKFID